MVLLEMKMMSEKKNVPVGIKSSSASADEKASSQTRDQTHATAATLATAVAMSDP